MRYSDGVWRWLGAALVLLMLGCGRTSPFDGIPGRTNTPQFVLVEEVAEHGPPCARRGDESDMSPASEEDLLPLDGFRMSATGCNSIIESAFVVRASDDRVFLMWRACGVDDEGLEASAGVARLAPDGEGAPSGQCSVSSPSPGRVRAVAGFATHAEADEAISWWAP